MVGKDALVKGKKKREMGKESKMRGRRKRKGEWTEKGVSKYRRLN